MAAEAGLRSIDAGELALSVHAAADALTHFERAARLAADLDPAHRIRLDIGRGQSLERLSRIMDAYACYQRLAEPADKKARLAALLEMTRIKVTANELIDLSEGERLAGEALSLSRELGDARAEATVLWNLSNVYRFTSRLDESLDAGLASLSMAETAGDPMRAAYAANDLGYVHLALCEPKDSEAMFAKAVSAFRSLTNLPMLTDGLSNLATFAAWSGRWDDYERYISEARGLA
ncbi:MAG: hypothetical protein OEW91_14935, partial [Acidimicrobiia bacterium]|nr:hypothetical protein [Acidimicrobiia bacterium]